MSSVTKAQIKDTSQFNKDFIKVIIKKVMKDIFLKLMFIQYSENLHNLHNNLPFLPEIMKIKKFRKKIKKCCSQVT